MEFGRHHSLPKMRYYGKTLGQITGSVGRYLLRKKSRSAQLVNAEYNLGSWKRTLEEQSWLKYKSLADYVGRKGETSLRLCLIDGQAVEKTNQEYYQYRQKQLAELISPYFRDSEAIVELGCGAGANIFSLALEGKRKKLIGLDISKNGVLAAGKVRDHFGVENVKFDSLDLTDGSSPNWSFIAGQTAFSFFCLEQLSHSIPKVIENILAARPRRVVHVETSWDLLTRGSLIDVATAFHVISSDYQRTLLGELKKREKLGQLRIEKAQRLGFAPTLRNFPTLTVWEPT